MRTLTAENRFRFGLMSLVERSYDTAATAFKEAADIEAERGLPGFHARYLSYYGFALAHTRGSALQAVVICETAARRSPLDPDVLCNLGRVLKLAGDTARAAAVFRRGLKLSPHHQALQAEIARLGRRSTPPLAFLRRSRPLKRALGRLGWGDSRPFRYGEP